MKIFITSALIAISLLAYSQERVNDIIVQASCGQCNFDLDAKKGCDLAIKHEDKFYLVKNTGIDDHGDSHAKNGFCNSVRQAKVSGIIKDDLFFASKFELIKSDLSTKTTTCQLVEKSFVNKGGKITEYTELYLRCSIQDYFIKICESEVSREDLLKYLDKGIEVEMEIVDGMWDHCDENEAYAQSRTGSYVIIKKIIE